MRSSAVILICFVAALDGGIWLWRAGVVHLIEPHTGQVSDGEKSADLPGDLRRMWETERLGGTLDPTHGPNPRSSTDRAINAASRVLNTVDLVGRLATRSWRCSVI